MSPAALPFKGFRECWLEMVHDDARTDLEDVNFAVALKHLANLETAELYHSVSKIARKAQRSPNFVIARLQKFEELHYVERVGRHIVAGKPGPGTVIYRLTRSSSFVEYDPSSSSARSTKQLKGAHRRRQQSPHIDVGESSGSPGTESPHTDVGESITPHQPTITPQACDDFDTTSWCGDESCSEPRHLNLAPNSEAADSKRSFKAALASASRTESEPDPEVRHGEVAKRVADVFALNSSPARSPERQRWVDERNRLATQGLSREEINAKTGPDPTIHRRTARPVHMTRSERIADLAVRRFVYGRPVDAPPQADLFDDDLGASRYYRLTAEVA